MGTEMGANQKDYTYLRIPFTIIFIFASGKPISLLYVSVPKVVAVAAFYCNSILALHNKITLLLQLQLLLLVLLLYRYCYCNYCYY